MGNAVCQSALFTGFPQVEVVEAIEVLNVFENA